jgi:hypothetical protein
MKKRKLPKQPKSKSPTVWESYLKRLRVVVAHNKGVEAAKKKRKANSPAAKVRKYREQARSIKLKA